MPNCPHSLEIIHQDMRIEISHKASVLFLFTQVHGCAKWNKFIKFETSQIIQVSSSANNLFTTTRSALTLRYGSRQPSQVFSCPWGVTFIANMKKSRQWVILGKSRHAFHFMLFRTFFLLSFIYSPLFECEMFFCLRHLILNKVWLHIGTNLHISAPVASLLVVIWGWKYCYDLRK